MGDPMPGARPMSRRDDREPGGHEGQPPIGTAGAGAPRGAAGRRTMTPRTVRLLQAALVLTVVAVPMLAYLLAPGVRTEVGIIVDVVGRGDVAAIGDRLRSYGPWAPVVSVGLMIAQAIVAPIPAFLVVFANGLAFGVFWGWLLSLVGQTLAAAVCFWLARALVRSSVERLVGRFGLASADRWFARWGVVGLFLTRLVPGIGFDGVSYAAGLTRIGFGRFTAVTVAGSAPQLLLYAFLGQNAPRYLWLLLAATTVVAVAVGVTALARSRRAAGHGPAAPRGIVDRPPMRPVDDARTPEPPDRRRDPFATSPEHDRDGRRRASPSSPPAGPPPTDAAARAAERGLVRGRTPRPCAVDAGQSGEREERWLRSQTPLCG